MSINKTSQTSVRCPSFSRHTIKKLEAEALYVRFRTN